MFAGRSVCVCVCAFVFVSVCDVYVHLSVKVTIGSGFNLHEKIMSECNQMGCVCALPCTSYGEGRPVFTRWTG